MAIPFPSLLSVTPLYIAILGLLFLVFTARVGIYRFKTKIAIGTGDDPEMLRRMRGQANFVETVPISLIVFITMELLGATDTWLHVLCLSLVTGRIVHYLGICGFASSLLRPIGMAATIFPIAAASIWVFFEVL